MSICTYVKYLVNDVREGQHDENMYQQYHEPNYK